MEITFSRKMISQGIGLILITAALFAGYYAWSQDWLDRWLTGPTPQTQPVTEPAIQSLTALYAPNGERAEWETQVCAGMTEQGCQLFRTLFANPIWNSALNGKTSSVTFIEISETLEDGSQVWKTEVADGETTLPVYIHVTKNETGQWLLNRVLFAQEAAKYENKK